MKKRNQKLLSLFLSAMMVVGVVPSTVYAAPEQATEIAVEQEAGTEATNEDTVINENEADASADQAQENTDEAQADDTAQENEAAAEEAEAQSETEKSETPVYTIGNLNIKFDGANAAVAEALTKDAKIDETDPTIQQLRKELEEVKVEGGEAGASNNEANINTADLYDDEAEGQAESKKLTKEEIDKVLQMFSTYKKQWQDNADVLGVQMPFYLSYNDNDPDGLGVLGEMLVLAGKTVKDVREGNYSYDDITGMILNFQYGDSYGIEYYGKKVKEARNAGLQAVKDSGAKTEAQKLLALNDYLAKIDTFDMAYIMNSSDEKGDETMVAPTPTQNENWKTMYDAMHAIYEKSMKETFENKIKDGVFAQATQQTVRENHKDMSDTEFDAYLKTEEGQNEYNQYYPQVKAGIEKDGMNVPVTDADGNPVMGEDGKPKTQHKTLDEIVAEQMDTPMADLGGATPNQALPGIVDEAATKLTDGIVNYWEGTQFGAMALGKSVCLGYSKAYAYMIQCMHPEMYLKEGTSDIDVADNWKTTEELYYTEDENGKKKLDIDKNYAVDLVRITFDTDVTMYGTKNSGFNSDHFWNAVKVDGKWYYIDPCYTDVYTEVMSRDRGEINGAMNHMYFMFSHTSAVNLYKDYYSELKTLYASAATDKSYEDSWMSRIRSNTSFDGNGNAYYSYDSTNMIGMVGDNNNSDFSSMMNAKYKIVQHDMSKGDTAGESDFTTLIFVNYTEKEASMNEQPSIDDYYAQVYNPETKKLEVNDELTTIVRQYLKQSSVYPSIFTSSAYYNGKVYFNISNDIFTYDLATGKVVLVKEYNEVVGHRDLTEAFGAVAFSTSGTADETYDITVNNAPIAGFVIKDGMMYVSIATNYAWVSGRTEHDVYESQPDENGQYKMKQSIKKDENGKTKAGYSFQESNYNQNYSNYNTSFGGNDETNDNDEFMWTATITDAVDMKHLDAEDGHSFETVEVAPTCGKDGYTEERCKTCKKIKEGSRKIKEKTAVDHHYVHYNETYYTKADNSSTWNKGKCYVCVDCGYAVQSDADTDGLNKDEKVIGARDTYALAEKKAGHIYTVDDDKAITWETGEDGKVTAKIAKDTALSCKDCASKKLDCLQSYEEAGQTITSKTTDEVTLDGTTTFDGTCDKGVTTVYTANGKVDNNKIVATKEEKKEAGKHTYTGNWTWEETKDGDGNVTDATAKLTDVKCEVCKDEPKDDQIKKVNVKKDAENSKAATCTEAGKDVYVATATITDADGKEIDSLTDTHEVELKALGHKYGETEWKWAEDHKSATATRVCENDPSHVDTAEVKVEEKSEGATCTKGGKITYTATAEYADGKTETTSETVEVEALGHDYEEPTWNWSKNDDGEGYTAVATFKCKRGDDEKKEVATVTSDTKAATCEEEGATTYTATVHFNNKDYTTGEKDVKVVKIKATGHAYGEPKMEWTEGENNTYTAKATRVCANDPSHVDEKAAEVTEKPEGATCTEGGKITYTATAKFDDGTECNDTKVKEDVPALGHNYEVTWKWAKDNESAKATFTCSRCKDSHEVEAKVDKKEEDGQTVYTATAEYAGITKTDVKKTKLAIYYQVHCQDYGWEVDEKDDADLTKWKSDGAKSGTEGESKRLEGIRIQLPEGVSGSVEYRTHIQNTGWETKWKKDGEVSGTSGKSLRLEAIQVKLTGKVADNYEVYYCVHAQNFGWLNWAKNGEEAGTAGYGYRLEAIKIMLVPKGEKAPAKVGDSDKAMEARLVGYQTHVQDFGTQAYVYDGAVAGTSGQAKRMESIRINLPSTMASEGKIEYRSHVQNIGWEKDWKQTNQLSGTTGKSLRLEAIQMKLSGDIAKEYDVYYRVHAQNFGWLGWAKNGEEAGTAGYSYRLEAIQVVMVPKGTENPQLPGVASATKEAFIQK